METEASEYFVLPPFLQVFCMMSAMAFIEATLHWLRQVEKQTEPDVKTLGQTVWRFQRYSALAVIFIFLLNSLYEGLRSGFAQGILFGPELIITGGAIGLYIFHCYREGTQILWSLIREIGKIALLTLACLSGWVITVAIGFFMILIFTFCIEIERECGDPGIGMYFLCGLSWIAFIYVLYRRGPRTIRFHDILWPVALAYLVLIVPLQMQQTFNSEEWQNIKTAKPSLKRV